MLVSRLVNASSGSRFKFGSLALWIIDRVVYGRYGELFVDVRDDAVVDNLEEGDSSPCGG